MLRCERKRASPVFENVTRWRKTRSPCVARGGPRRGGPAWPSVGTRRPWRRRGRRRGRSRAPVAASNAGRAPGHRLGEHGVFAVAGHAAGVAVAPLAVLGPHLLLRLDELDLEPPLLDRDVEDVPGQDLVEVVGAQVRLLRDALGLEGLHPEVVAEMLGPAVEAHARLPGRVEDAADAPVAAREHALDLGLARLVPLHLRAADVAELLLEIGELPLERSRRRRRAPTGTASTTSARRSRRRR